MIRGAFVLNDVNVTGCQNVFLFGGHFPCQECVTPLLATKYLDNVIKMEVHFRIGASESHEEKVESMRQIL
jgi:hypothetical protein